MADKHPTGALAMRNFCELALLSNVDATGETFDWPGGRGEFCVVGTFGGATVSLEKLGPDGSTWVLVGTDAALTSAGMVGVELAQGSIRASVTGGTPANLYARLSHVGNI